MSFPALLPAIRVYIGLDKDIVLEGPGVADFDADDYADIKFSCAALGITKLLSTAGITSSDAGATLTIHLVAADTSGKTQGNYPYQLQEKVGSVWHDVAGTGPLFLEPTA